MEFDIAGRIPREGTLREIVGLYPEIRRAYKQKKAKEDPLSANIISHGFI